MSNPFDAWLNWFDSRCEEDGDCLVWTGAKTSDGRPMAMIDGKTKRIRPVVWQITRGMPVPKGRKVCDTCNNPLCLLPSHLIAWTAKEYMAEHQARGNLYRPLRALHIRQAKQAAALKLDEVKAAEIFGRANSREMTKESLGSIARDYGVHPSTVDKIGKGKAWAQIGGARTSSIFTMGAPA